MILLDDRRRRDFRVEKRVKFSGITMDKLIGNSVVAYSKVDVKVA